jgi:hypothetical protein
MLSIQATKINNYFKKKELLLILIIYTICHFPMLLLAEAKFWDDWLIFGISDANLIKTFTDAGYTWVGYFHLLFRSWGPELYKILSFLALLIPPFASFFILKRLGLSRSYSFWVAVFIAVLPLYHSRITAISVPSSVSNAFFFIAWTFLLISLKGRFRYIYSIISVILFSFSFSYSALVVFYLIPLLSYIYLQNFEVYKYKLLNLYALMPILVFILYRYSALPTGNYAGYNSVGTNPLAMLAAFGKAITEMFNVDSSFGVYMFFLYLPIVLIGIYFSFPRTQAVLGRLRFHMLAITAVCVAFIPFLLVSKYPSFIDWGSRLQLIFPFGIALLLIESERRIKAQIRKCSTVRTVLILPLLLLFSIALSWANYANYQLDWAKQILILDGLKKSSELNLYNTFIVEDGALNLNAYSRSYRFYEVAGMFEEAKLNTPHFIATNYELVSAIEGGDTLTEFLKKMDPFVNGQYMLKSSSASNKIALITISAIPYTGIPKGKIVIKMLFSNSSMDLEYLKSLPMMLKISIHDVTTKYLIE